ncbi:DUF397 domain-containing protein [Spirillospora albida]|uniref:DUF397 domain-containing protein n=1 Tax=Spirillospora albida TaxID=58123 RepID=UPI001FDEC52C|nr:DUF397 domain-containing protein [Spirillospora albida]
MKIARADEWRWRKSSYSGGSGGECVELAATPTSVSIRDSKDPNGSVLCIAPIAYQSMLVQLRSL